MSYTNRKSLLFSTPNPFATRFIQPGAIPYQFPQDVSLESLTSKLLIHHHGRAAIVGPHGSGKTSLLYALAPHLGIIHQHHLCQGDPIPSAGLHHAFSSTRSVTTTENDHQQQSSLQHSPKQIYWFRLMSRRNRATHGNHVAPKPPEDPGRVLLRSVKHWNRHTLLIVDGWEQLSPMLRGWMYWAIRRAGSHILVTSHRPTLFPTLWKTNVQPEIAQRVIQALLVRHAADTSAPVTPMETNEVFGDDMLSPELLKNRLTEYQGSLREVLFVLYDDFERTCRSRPGNGS